MHNVELYEKNNQVQARDALMFLEKQALTFRWKKNTKKIIDVGSGDGKVTIILKTFIPCESTLLGCDINGDMVKYANDRYGDEQTSFKKLNIAGELPEKMNGNFDYVFSFYTLHWIKDQQRAFSNIFNLLAQDGECFMIYLAWNPICDAIRIQSQNEKWRYWLNDVDNFVIPYQDSKDPASEVIKIMESVGFVDINVECEEMNFVYDDMETFKKAVRAILPFKIPEDKQEEFTDEFFEHLAKIDDSKDTQVNYTLLIVNGRKQADAEI